MELGVNFRRLRHAEMKELQNNANELWSNKAMGGPLAYVLVVVRVRGGGEGEGWW